VQDIEEVSMKKQEHERLVAGYLSTIASRTERIIQLNEKVNDLEDRLFQTAVLAEERLHEIERQVEVNELKDREIDVLQSRVAELEEMNSACMIAKDYWQNQARSRPVVMV